MKKFTHSIIVLVFLCSFLITLLVKREAIPFKMYYVSVLLSLGLSVFLIVMKLVPALNNSNSRAIRILSLLVLFFMAGVTTFVAIAVNEPIKIITTFIGVLNLVALISIYMKDTFSEKLKFIRLHWFIMLFLAGYHVFIF